MKINSFASALAALTLPIVLPTAAQTTVRYMPLGDSITEITCWRSLLWTQLQETGYENVNFVGSMTTENPAGCSIENYNHHSEGHQGYSAVGIVNGNDLVGWLNNNPADVITMHLGTNDIFGGQSTQQILSAFTTLIQQMRNSNPRMKIIVCSSVLLFTLYLHSHSYINPIRILTLHKEWLVNVITSKGGPNPPHFCWLRQYASTGLK